MRQLESTTNNMKFDIFTTFRISRKSCGRELVSHGINVILDLTFLK